MLEPRRFTLLPKQRDMIQVPHAMDLDCCLYVGGFGSGKTHGGTVLGLLVSYFYPGSRGIVGAAEYTMLRDTTRLKYEELIPDGWIAKWRRGPDNLVLKNGSEIWFRSLGESERLKSKEFNWAHIEEASQVSHETFRMLMGRLRHNGNGWLEACPELAASVRRKRMWLTTNPEETPGWLYRLFEDGAWRAENDIGENYRRVHAPTNENHFLLSAQPEYVERLLQVYDEESAEVYVYGRTGNMGGRRVYHAFDATQNVRRDLGLRQGLPICLCCDFNVEPMVWVVAQVQESGEIWVIDEIAIDRDALTEDGCRQFRAKYSRWTAGVRVYADASGGSRSTTAATTNHDILRRELGGQPGFHWRVPRRNPPVRDRIVIVNGLLCNSRGRRRLLVHPRCKHVARDFQEVMRPRSGLGEFEKVSDVSDGRHVLTHASDALGYMACVEFPIARTPSRQAGRILI